jgi:renalase
LIYKLFFKLTIKILVIFLYNNIANEYYPSLMTNKIVLIGAGFSSAVLSKKIKSNNLIIYDKGRGPGGRSSTRRADTIGVFDHGLQFISPKKKEFQLFLEHYLMSFIKEWKGDFFLFEKKQRIDKKKYIGKYGNNDFVKNLISKNVYYQKELLSIKKVYNKWLLKFSDNSDQECEKLILSIPLEQCQKIILPLNLDFKVIGSMEPNLTAMVAFDKSLGIAANGFKFEKNYILSWVANENSKERTENNPDLELWTMQSNIFFAQKKFQNYKDNKEQVINLMVNEFLNLFKIKNTNIVHKDIHGWLYAFKKKNFSQKFYWNKDINLGICGDWMCGPNAEDAWLSATALADQINNS